MRGLHESEERRAVVDETAWAGARRGLVIRLVPNCSLTPRQALAFFASLCLVSLAIAGFFAARGLWPVLPFAGLEMALLGWAMCASLRRRKYTQTITLTHEAVEVVTCDARGARAETFRRHWARARIVRAGSWHPSRLLIESRGRRCEVGGLLTEDERCGLHARLLSVIGGIDESPGLEAATGA